MISPSLVECFLWVGIVYFLTEIIDTIRYWFKE